MFRLDINGLRFIAVTLVVLFHFKISLFYGGYAGVDIFFVISGFLMNEICKKKLGGKGWVLDFYRKRFHRIYPALLSSCIFVFLLLGPLSPPSLLIELTKEVFSALTFTSNIYYWRATSGYFSDTADSFSLLHTWSLSAEWQFYLIFPLLIYVAYKFKNKINPSVFYGLLALISLVLCLFVSNINQSASFYLLPTRAWELLIGAFASSLSVNNKYPKQTELLSLMGIILFTLLIKESHNWPGIMTLIPTLCTAAILHANVGNDDTVLRNKIAQKIGSASYSIYLFHWPIVTYYYSHQIDFNFSNQIIGVFLSIVFGFISYFFIEKKWSLSFKKTILFTALFLSFSYTCASINITKFWLPERMVDLDKYHSYGDSIDGNRQFGNEARTCFLTSGVGRNNFKDYTVDSCLNASSTKKNILLVGDSHAAEFYESMTDVFKESNIMQTTASGCMPLINTQGAPRCTEAIKQVLTNYIYKYDIDTVIISANWIDHKGSMDKLYSDIVSTNNVLKSKVKNVYFIGQSKNFKLPFYRIAQIDKPERISEYIEKNSADLNSYLMSKLANSEVKYIDIYDFECDKNKTNCQYFDDNGSPYMFDKNHFTLPWATKVVGLIKSKIESSD